MSKKAKNHKRGKSVCLAAHDSNDHATDTPSDKLIHAFATKDYSVLTLLDLLWLVEKNILRSVTAISIAGGRQHVQ